MKRFRVRWANVEVCHGTGSELAMRCIAEQSMAILGVHLFWWPLPCAEWRTAEADAVKDIASHMASQNLPAPKEVKL